MLSQQISEEQENETINREIDVNDSRVSQRISIHEIYESNEIEKLVKQCFDLGINLTLFSSDNEKSDYHLVTHLGSDDKKEVIDVNSISNFLETIRKLGRKGLQIQRYKKGLVK